MTIIRENLQIIGAKVEQYISLYKRPPKSVQLLAVSKRHPATSIREAYACGQRLFGENYAQELLEKSQELDDLAIDWHFIGPLQSNKAKRISEVANWVHTVDRLKVAKRLNDSRPEGKLPLSICLQVNISGEESKSGVKAKELLPLAKEISELSNIRLRGLMAIPASEGDITKQRRVFAELADLKDNLQKELTDNGFNITLDTLSMGMSNDSEAAIAEGSTMIRVGTAIFGQREY